MQNILKILYLEHIESDVEAIQAALVKGNVSHQLLHITTKSDYINALKNNSIDVILATYTLPGFNGLSALKIARQEYPEVPFIFVSGTIYEELIVDSLKMGATDCVIKDRLYRLAPSIQRALKENNERIEKSKLQIQLQHAQKMEAIGTMANGIAHDFNNILSSIALNAEMAYEDISDNDDARYCIDQVLRGSQRAKELIEQILRFSRETAADRRIIRIDGIIKETLKMLRSLLPTTIRLHYNIPSDIPMILANPTQIQQIVMNLCNNSAHAMKDGGGDLHIELETVSLEASLDTPDVTPGLYLKLMIRDSGHGIPDSHKPRIFDPFFTTKKPEEGTGLGLSVVHGIVISNKGIITVDSEPNQGATFNVYFPATLDTAVQFSHFEEPLSNGNERILLIDDETDIVDVGKRMLERLGYQVTATNDAVNALKLFKTNPNVYDLVITDMTMPYITGAELARELMKIRVDIPIIMCSGYNSQLTSKAAKEIGIRNCIMKPFVKREIAKIIREALI